MNSMELKGNDLKLAVRGVLDRHELGAGRLAEHDGVIYVFLDSDRQSHMGIHLAMSELEKQTGRSVQIRSVNDLNPAELARVHQQATSV